MTIFDIVVALILSLNPPLSGEDVDRYAADITFAADDDVNVAIALIVVQDSESTWRRDVESCKVTGDGGKAISSVQIHRHWWSGYSRAEICASNRLAVTLAANVITVLSESTGSTRAALRAYVGCSSKDPRAVRRWRKYDELQRLRRKLHSAPTVKVAA